MLINNKYENCNDKSCENVNDKYHYNKTIKFSNFPRDEMLHQMSFEIKIFWIRNIWTSFGYIWSWKQIKTNFGNNWRCKKKEGENVYQILLGGFNSLDFDHMLIEMKNEFKNDTWKFRWNNANNEWTF